MKRLTEQILDKVMQINEKTDYAAFFEIAGHVSKIDVRVSRGKGRPLYNEYLYDEYFYYNEEASDVIKSVLDKLDEYLENN